MWQSRTLRASGRPRASEVPRYPPRPEGSMSLFTAHRRTLTLAAILAAAALIVAGCSKKSTSVLEPNGPDMASIKNGGELSMANPAVLAVTTVQDRHTAD